MATLLRGIGKVLAGMFCLAVALTVTFYIIAPLQLIQKAETSVFGEAYTRANGDYSAEKLPFEVDMTNQAIADWVARCIGGYSLQALPYELQQQINLFAGPNSGGVTSQPPQLRDMLPSERALVTLNQQIGMQRFILSRSVHREYIWLQVSTIAAIVIGLATTVIVSISTTEFGKGDAPSARRIRFLAIFFPALGTAIAAITGFYTPRDELNKSSNALAGLTQLHDQMALELGATRCATSADDKAPQLLADWRKRYVEVQSLSATRTSPSADIPGEKPKGS